MKIKTNQKNLEMRNVLRNALIRRIDTALDAEEPDMDTVDLCSKLLDALEHGSCQPSGKRMQQELSRLAEEIDYIPGAHAMVTVKPMTVRRALVGVLAACMCLILLPITVILLRGGNQTLSGQESTETSSVAAETFCHADTDHIHEWETCIVEIPSEEAPEVPERHIQKECSVCGAEDSTLPPDLLLLTLKIERMLEEKESMIAAMEEAISETQERMKSMAASLESAVADQDKTDMNKEISIMEDKIAEMEKRLQFMKENLQSAIEEREFILSQYVS